MPSQTAYCVTYSRREVRREQALPHIDSFPYAEEFKYLPTASAQRPLHSQKHTEMSPCHSGFLLPPKLPAPY